MKKKFGDRINIQYRCFLLRAEPDPTVVFNDYRREPAELKQISGGLLVQEVDAHFAPASEWTLAAGPAADEATLADLDFAWRACRAVKSNGILLATNGASVGVGMGQVNRVDSCKLAVERAGRDGGGFAVDLHRAAVDLDA